MNHYTMHDKINLTAKGLLSVKFHKVIVDSSPNKVNFLFGATEAQ